MQLNKEILLSLLSAEDQRELRKLLSVVPNKKLEHFRDEYINALKGIRSEKYIRSIELSFSQLINFTGNIALSKIDVRIAEKFILTIFRKSPSSAVLYYKTLRAAFSKALLYNYIIENPWTKFRVPKVQKPKMAYLTPGELQIILGYTNPAHLKAIFLFAFYTGMRAGEICNITWKNVNLKDKLIQVGDSNFNTKSRSIRVIPVNDIVVGVLRIRLPKIISPKMYVFRNRSGYKYTVDYISKAFKRACRAAEVDEKIHLHSLRHSYASNLVKEGVDLYVVKNLLGHSSITTTQCYAHLNIDVMRDAVLRLSVVEGGCSL